MDMFDFVLDALGHDSYVRSFITVFCRTATGDRPESALQRAALSTMIQLSNKGRTLPWKLHNMPEWQISFHLGCKDE